MKSLTLGFRLGIAFGALILVMCVLGGVAIWRMSQGVKASKYVSDELAAAIHFEGASLATVWDAGYELDTFALTGNAENLRKGRKNMLAVKDVIKEGEELVKKFPDLTVVAADLTATKAEVAEMEDIIESVEANYKELDQAMGICEKSYAQYMEVGLKLRANYKQKYDEEIETLTGAVKGEASTSNDETKWGEASDNAALAHIEKIKARTIKQAKCEDIIDVGNFVRRDTFDALRKNDMEAMNTAINRFEDLAKAIAFLAPLTTDKENMEQLDAIKKAGDDYKVALADVVKQRKEAIASELKFSALVEKATAESHDSLEKVSNLVDVTADSVTNGLSMASTVLIVGLILAMAVAVLVAWVSTRAITVPIREGVATLTATAAQITATVAQLASSSSEAATSVAETTTTVDEIRQTSMVAAEKAKAVADGSHNASTAAEAGRQATERTVDGLNKIRDQMSSIGESITRLSEQSQAVGDIVTTVADLAEQSNLLAVNASIEAAKAGDMGKGFAVVAQEIRNLAEQSKDSTKQVRAILTEVQKATAKAVLAAEQGGKTVVDGSKQADEAGVSIRTLTTTVQEATRSSAQIAASSQQQLVGMEQVGRAMDNIKQATQQNSEGARQLEAASHNLQDVALRLKGLVDAGGGVITSAQAAGKR